MNNVSELRRETVKVELTETNVLTRWPCHVCGGHTEKVSTLAEVRVGNYEGFRVCERCIESRDFDNKLRETADRYTKQADDLRALIGRLEVPTAAEYYERDVEHQVAFIREQEQDVRDSLLWELASPYFTHEPSRQAHVDWLLRDGMTQQEIQSRLELIRAEQRRQQQRDSERRSSLDDFPDDSLF